MEKTNGQQRLLPACRLHGEQRQVEEDLDFFCHGDFYSRRNRKAAGRAVVIASRSTRTSSRHAVHLSLT